MPLPSRTFRRIAALLCAFAGSCLAQAIRSSAGELNNPRVEVFVGYSYFHPVAADINYFYYKNLPYGGTASATVFLKPWLGIQLQGATHVLDFNGNNQLSTGDLGLQFQKNVGHFTPFAHVLGGISYFGGPAVNPNHLGYNGTAGLGIDYVPMLRHEWLGLRLLQLDYQYNHNDFGPLVLPAGNQGGVVKMNTAIGSAGIVLRFGGREVAHEEPQMSCGVDHVEIMPGEPVVVTSQYLGFSVKEPIQYSWTTAGGRISGAGDTVNIDTTGLGSGDYRVSGSMMQGGGRRARVASCVTGFSIRQPQPPTVSCVANPATITLGSTSVVTATGISPQNRPLTYTFLASIGRLVTNGNTATVRPQTQGDIIVTCNVSDDQGRTATATTTVSVSSAVSALAAQPRTDYAPLPLQRDLCTVGFTRDRRRPARVDNEAKACLDDVALSLQRDPDSNLVLIGDHTRGETAAIAAERAVNVKLYLTQEKGLDPGRIQLRSEDTGEARVQSIFVPIGATFAEEGRIVNEATVTRHGEAYGTRSYTGRATTRRRTTTRRRRVVRRGTSTPPPPPAQ